jgi:hypothetical protein
MSSCLSVARIGGSSVDNVSADMLRKSLLHHFSQTHSSSATVVLGVVGDDQDDSTTTAPRLTVTNRYFSAHVILQEIGQDPLPVNAPAVTAEHEPQPQQHGDDLDVSSDSLPFKEDGVILVFDHVVTAESGSSSPSDQCLHVSTAAASFNALEPVHDRAEALCQAGELLRLCVGVSVHNASGAGAISPPNNNNTKEYEAEYARRILWCLDRGYEYVEVDLSPEGVKQGHDVRDKEGFARVVEAVCGTVWSSAVMGGDKQKELKQQFAQAQATAAAAAAAVDAKDGEDVKQENNVYEPPDPSKLPPITASLGETEEDRERGEKAREAIFQQKNVLTDPSSEYLDDGLESIGVGPDVVQQRQKEIEQERFMNDFEGALRQASRIRDVSKSGAISDEERRQRAGDAADLLMGLMGKMGDFDDDDETDEEDGAVEGDLMESKEKE